jgi:inward rectifier potassium channel
MSGDKGVQPPLRKRHAARPVRVAGLDLFTTGASGFDLRDPYHFIATMSWPVFFLCLVVSELLINSGFALLYIAVPGSIANVPAGSFIDAFFFSIETLATVGYGTMVPATRYGHVISAVEIICGIVYTAVVTGVIFIRFSKPKAKIVYAERPVVANHNGVPTLMIRIANGRTHMLTDASVRLSALIMESTPEGQQFRRLQGLELSLSHFPLFALTWTLMHKIDVKSPLHGLSADTLTRDSVRLMLSLEARDPALSVQVHDLKSYPAEAIAFGMRYSDAVSWDDQGRTSADIRRISMIEPDLPASPLA